MSFTSLRLRVVYSLFLAIPTSACGRSTETSARLSGLAHSEDGHNVAVLMGAPNGLPGVATDIREVDLLFRDDEMNLGFNEVIKDDRASTRDIFTKTAQAAANADTLLWYFSGHGSRGVLLAEDRSFRFSEVADAVMSARNEKPLERLIVLIDSCYSGSFVDGRNPIIPGTKSTISHKCSVAADAKDSEDPFTEISRYEGTLYRQAFVLTSSTKDQSSVDLGRSRGGAFTWTLRGSITRFKTENPEATIRQISEKTRTDTKKIAGHTPVWRGIPSETVMNEKFFHY